MSLRTPPPLPEQTADPVLLNWANRLVAWLSAAFAEESTIEEDLVFGGIDMANRLFGFEGARTGTGTGVMLAAPTGTKKKIVVSITVTSDEPAAGTAQDVRVYRKIGANEYDIRTASIKHSTDLVIDQMIVLDDTDESIEIEVETGTVEVHWNGSFLDVD